MGAAPPRLPTSETYSVHLIDPPPSGSYRYAYDYKIHLLKLDSILPYILDLCNIQLNL